ncbi:Na+/H+ antiporter NhaC [Nosocomiicoccus ampullae]|uniref:NhaC family Na+:H+ antiporter n=1 Tax=Nosocomiicoccus ampullae TaxID=489910 RepID=A0A9Q2HEU2_9STAP|nr:Na+/H+ antiporter NhaC [Nosocomiicoccus ampullae]MBB5175196.1 NhaC family Na+:H+ antiporter [Nosocomiicoccus ampullae]QYA46426.1 Na+/H+ antiporter NhaC [Nosocomiicoccus ampullae]
MKRKPTLFEAVLPIIIMLLFLSIGFGILKLRPEPLLILSSVFAALITLKLGYSWQEMMDGIQEKISLAMPSILILISIGILIGTWMIAGTIPMLIYYGVQMINPKYILVISFVVAAIIAVVTGTSWGAVGTVGVALIGIATGLEANISATAGAIVAGAFFGDKLSPLSDTTILAPIAAGSELYDHIKHMLWTTIPATILSLIVYFIVGLNVESKTIESPLAQNMIIELEQMFNWNILLLIPPIIILYGTIRRYPTLPVIIISSITAGIIAMIFQKSTIQDVFLSTVSGFNVDMVTKIQVTENDIMPEVLRLVNQGGMEAMTSVVLIAFAAFVFAGIITTSGSLEVIIEALLKVVKRTGDLILATVLSCMTMALVTGNSYLSIIVPGEMYKDTYKMKKLAPKNLSRTLEDSGTVIVPLIPWSSAGVFMAATLGVPTLSYAPWAILCYTGFIFAIILGYTGIGITQLDEEK